MKTGPVQQFLLTGATVIPTIAIAPWFKPLGLGSSSVLFEFGWRIPSGIRTVQLKSAASSTISDARESQYSQGLQFMHGSAQDPGARSSLGLDCLLLALISSRDFQIFHLITLNAESLTSEVFRALSRGNSKSQSARKGSSDCQ